MFGLGFGEVVLLIIVAIVVVGPRQLPSMMRTAGQWVSRIRRMSTDLRAQSGIDQLMRDEGIDRSIQEIRALQNINVLDGLERMAQAAPVAPAARTALGTVVTTPAEAKADTVPIDKPATDKPADDKPVDAIEEKPGKVAREREYPLLGCDSYGALADDAAPYGAVATADPTRLEVDDAAPSGGAAPV